MNGRAKPRRRFGRIGCESDQILLVSHKGATRPAEAAAKEEGTEEKKHQTLEGSSCESPLKTLKR